MNELRKLVEVWESACADLLDLARQVDEATWDLPTDCPGWSARDVLAHCAALESELSGVEPMRVQIDKQAPHITSPAGVYTERGVVGRRGRSTTELISELEEAVAAHSALLAAEALDDPAGDPPITPGRIGWDWATLLRNRPIDIWVHEQDIRRAVGRPGGLDSVGAAHTQAVFAVVLPYVVAKRAAAPAGTTAVVDITGPVSAVYAVEVDESGRGLSIDPQGLEPTVRLTMDTETFTVLGAGRRAPETVHVTIDGDADLGSGILAGLNVAP